MTQLPPHKDRQSFLFNSVDNTHIKYAADRGFSRSLSHDYSCKPLKTNASNNFKTPIFKHSEHRSSNPLISYE